MTALGQPVSQIVAERLIEAVNLNADGELDFNEFICIMVKQLCKSDSDEEELMTVFKRFDKDGDGEIGVSDLFQMMQELGQNCDKEEARDMIFFNDPD
mmetsp:Transcript_29675/g.36812  ORF Transcript_29675/g.36812 Transcript_29675/m.36812 type:complete len:98 (+) Transcript_29675:136-429(+)